MAAKQEESTEAKQTESKPITLTIDDRRWYENLVMKERLVRTEAAQRLQQISVEAEEMMGELGSRHGADLRGYDINWQTGEAVPKAKPQEAKT